MYELIQISDTSYYLKDYINVGLIKTGPDTVCLIDSGNRPDTGESIAKILDGKGWKLETILNTHCHADHIRGNHFLQKNTGCKIYAPDYEYEFVCQPYLAILDLFDGKMVLCIWLMPW